MDMTPVASSNIAAVGYDVATKTLAVRFHSGDTYHYHGVSPESHGAFMAAKSKGNFLALSLKPFHTYTKQPREET